MARASRHYIPGYRIIDLDSIVRLIGCTDLQDMQSAHKRWVAASLRLDDENWKVRLIEEEFMKHMGDGEGK